MSNSIPRPSTPPQAVIERALVLYSNLVQSHEAVASELAVARSEFFVPGFESDSKADRRLFEWFLFERASDVIDGTAARVLAEDWLAAADESLAPMLSGLLDSRVGIFQVTSVEPAHGIWVRDLSGVGEYPLSETEAATEFTAGDLVVGRIYPIGDGVFQASSAAATIRSSDLAKALAKDLQAARNDRRGVPRISQLTIEAMFFAGALVAQVPGVSADEKVSEEQPSREKIIADCQKWLEDEGLTQGETEELFEALATEACSLESFAPGAQDMLGGILNELAFHSDIDLSIARVKLLAAWRAMWAKKETANEPKRSTPETQTTAGIRTEGADDSHREKARKALEAFDAAKSAGGNIEEVFRQLEEDLELESDESGDGDDKAPDFPGVVAAMVEEFLWENSLSDDKRVDGDALRKFAVFAGHIGAFEDIGHQDLLLYSGCWLIERGELKDEEDARRSLFALEQFSRWAEREHEIALWTVFAESFTKLWESVPRLVVANARLGKTNTNNRVLLYEIDSSGKARRVDAIEASFELQPELASYLREGDLVRGANQAGALEVLGCYPDEVRQILQPGT